MIMPDILGFVVERLDREIAELDADASKFFKSVHLNQYRKGNGFLDKE